MILEENSDIVVDTSNNINNVINELKSFNLFNDVFKDIDKCIPYPDQYVEKNIDEKYKNILSEVHTNNSKFELKLDTLEIPQNTIIRSYKYLITFNNTQKKY